MHCHRLMNSVILTLYHLCHSLPFYLSFFLPSFLPFLPFISLSLSVCLSVSLFSFQPLFLSSPICLSVSSICISTSYILLCSIPRTNTFAAIHSCKQQCDTRIAAANAGLDLRPLIISEIQGMSSVFCLLF